MLDLVVIASKQSPKLTQAVSSLLASTSLDINLLVVRRKATPALNFNRALSMCREDIVIFAEDDIFAHPSAPDALVEALCKEEMAGVAKAGDFFFALHRKRAPYLWFDEAFTDSHCLLDFYEQIRRKELGIVTVDDRIVSHGIHAESEALAVYNRAFFEEKWRQIRLGESHLLNPSRGY